MRRILFPFFILTLSLMSACGNGRSDTDTKKQSSEQSATQQSANALQTAAANPQMTAFQHRDLGYLPSPELKAVLKTELAAIQRWHSAQKGDKPIPRLITELYGLFKTLTVTARALDRDSSFAAEIQSDKMKFEETDRLRKSDAGRIMNGMTGVYSMYALLAKMKFLGQTDKQSEIQDIHDATVKTFQPEIPAVEAAAAIADACYSLTEMIMIEIDSENRFRDAFEHIERQYNQGVTVAKNEEDHFINGMFRTFEISQLWALSLNPERQEDVSQMNAGISDESADAKDVGTQMGVAVKYLFYISYVIAQDTIELTL